MLRVAVPNKGSLADPASAMLRESGYRQRGDGRDLVLHDAENDAEFFFEADADAQAENFAELTAEAFSELENFAQFNVEDLFG